MPMPCLALHGIAHSLGIARNIFQLLLGLRDVRVAKINLVDDGNNREIQLRRKVIIRHGLRLDPLGGILFIERKIWPKRTCTNWLVPR